MSTLSKSVFTAYESAKSETVVKTISPAVMSTISKPYFPA
jgi:hypothetical protein